MFNIDFSYINTEEFSPEANRFRLNSLRGKECYIDEPKNSLAYKEYWDLQEYYCLNGYSVGGVRITGEHYFYLNFCQIKLTAANTTGERIVKKKVEKQVTFPAFWDSDWYYFTECEIARENGEHMIVLKPRRRGYSYKNAAKCAYMYTFTRNSTSLIVAELSTYSEETMGMAVNYLNFLQQYTDFGKNRLVNKPKEEVESGFEENGIKVGFRSKILAFTTKTNAGILRGKDANIVLFEEAGTFGNLLATYNATKALVQEGTNVSGQMFVFGCVCAGTKVWTNSGKLVNIENLQQEDGILGYDSKGVFKEDIVWMKPPDKKVCYRIETSGGNYIECSEDHPLLWTNQKFVNYINNKPKKKVTFVEASKIKKGDQLLMIKEVPVFGNTRVIEARILGLLIGDGNYTKGATPQLSSSDEAIFKYVDETQEVTIYKHYRMGSGMDYKSIGIKNFQSTLVKHGLYAQVKLDKRLPLGIEHWDEHSICELLGGYYDADGNVYYNEKKNNIRIVLTSICQPLLEEVKYQLLKLGIRSSICKEYRNQLAAKISDGQLDHIYRLYINTSSDVKKFKEKIKFLSNHKQEVLNKIDNLIFKSNHFEIESANFEMNMDNKKGSYFIGNKDMKGMTFVTVTKVECIGEQPIYNLHTKTTNTYLSNGFITKQTGGDFAGGQVDFEKMFYDPITYGFRAYENIYDEGRQGTMIGYFLPDYYSKGGYISKGISEVEPAKAAIEQEVERLKRSSKDRNALDAYLAEFPRTPQEGFIKMGTNIFPKAELNQQINEIRSRKELQHLGTTGIFYTKTDGKVYFDPKDDLKPILNFPYKPDVDGEGCVIMYQPAYKLNGEVPHDLYYIAVDPYAIDKSKDKKITKRDSLGAAYVFKRINNFSKPFDLIVCEYVARPNFHDDFNKTLFDMAEYYNCKIVYENDRDGDIESYARIHKKLHRLEVELTVYDSSDAPRKQLGRRYGVSMSNLEVKKTAVSYLKDWLLSPRDKDLNGVQELNLHKIYSIPLLEEIIKFDYEGNFDRVSAMLVAMLYKKELLLKPPVQEIKRSVYDDEFFNRFDSSFVKNELNL